MLVNNRTQQNLQDILLNENVYDDVYILLGELNKNIIGSTISIITNKLTALNYSKSIITKAKLITIELLENINKHQAEAHTFAPYFELLIDGSALKFTAGNCVTKEESEELATKLDKYDKMTQEKINEEYFQVLKTGIIDTEGNAGLGLLTLLRRSRKNYEFNMDKINDEEFFFNSTIILNC